MANTFAFDTNLSYDRLSSKLRQYAQERTILSQFVKEEEFLGGKKGQTYKFSAVANLAVPYTTAPTPETDRTADNKLSTVQDSVTLSEYSTAVKLTDFAIKLDDFDIKSAHQRALADWLRKTRDALVYTELHSTDVAYTPTGSAGASQTYTLDTDGTVSTEAARAVNAADLIEMQSILADTYKCPPYEGENTGNAGPGYIVVATRTTLQKILSANISGIVDIRQDIRDAFNGSGNGNPLLRGYVGTWNGLHFVEENFIIPTTVGSSTGGSVGPVNGELYMFGADAVFSVTAMKANVFADPPEDGGRFQRLVMRGIWANKLVWNAPSTKQVRVIKVAST